MNENPILWTFRRCPYAMRARLAIASSRVNVDLREIMLRDKPAAFLATSTKGTVPVVDTGQSIIDESRDVMLWALGQNDPEDWLDMPSDALGLIDTNDGPFKKALDHTKYSVRFPERDASAEREKAAGFLRDLDARLRGQSYLAGEKSRLADAAIRPFVRQFANTDRLWFDAQDWPDLRRWLVAFETSPQFAFVMQKFSPWQPGDPPIPFP